MPIGTAPLFVNSNTLVDNLNADLLDGQHLSAFSLSGHTHLTLSNGIGINVLNYNGSSTAIVSLNNTGVTMGTYGSSTDIPLISVDLQGRITSATMLPINILPTSHIHESLTFGDGVNSGSFNGSTATTASINFGGNGTAISVSRSDHFHPGSLSGNGIATQVAFWNPANVLSGNNAFFWDNIKERLGVGLNTPQSKLHVHSTEMIDGSIIIIGGGSTRNTKNMSDEDSLSKTLINLNQPYALTTFQITNKTTNMLATDGFIISLKDNDAFFTLQEKGDMMFSANDQNILSIFKEGKVGIGTSSKDAKLNIASLKSNGLKINSINNEAGYALQCMVNVATTKIFEGMLGSTTNFVVFGDGKTGIGTANPQSKLVVIGVGNTLSTSSLDIRNNSNSSLFFVRDDGKVGIGTTCPDATLSVNGKLHSKDEITVDNTGGWCDYIFSDISGHLEPTDF